MICQTRRRRPAALCALQQYQPKCHRARPMLWFSLYYWDLQSIEITDDGKRALTGLKALCLPDIILRYQLVQIGSRSLAWERSVPRLHRYTRTISSDPRKSGTYDSTLWFSLYFRRLDPTSQSITACTECVSTKFGTDSSDGRAAINIYIAQFQYVNWVARQLLIHEARGARMWVSVQSCIFLTPGCPGR